VGHTGEAVQNGRSRLLLRVRDVIHAHHTAEVVPGAKLVVFDDHGHFSIVTKVVPAISNLLQR